MPNTKPYTRRLEAYSLIYSILIIVAVPITSIKTWMIVVALVAPAIYCLASYLIFKKGLIEEAIRDGILPTSELDFAKKVRANKSIESYFLPLLYSVVISLVLSSLLNLLPVNSLQEFVKVNLIYFTVHSVVVWITELKEVSFLDT